MAYKEVEFGREPTLYVALPTSYVGLGTKGAIEDSNTVLYVAQQRHTCSLDSIAWSFISRGNDIHFTVVLLVQFGALVEIRVYQFGIEQLGLNELFRNPLSPGPNALLPVITVVNPCRRDLKLLLAGTYG
ncbi:hypothetical protein PIB30_056097 [Stylosanthes scabra]|uniref:Uncharacterized protein n=1 Tax=Stylosanthes scabra TaxID=79078 RepID=A0ABU6WMM8_9FABA|nr:hypothetical protein [Stylosanthes scabra]